MVPQFDTYAASLKIERKLAHQRAERWGSLDGAVPARRPAAKGGRVWIVSRPLGWLSRTPRTLRWPRRLSNLTRG